MFYRVGKGSRCETFRRPDSEQIETRFFRHRQQRTELISRPLRFTEVRGYLIACAPDEKPLWVVAVIHGRRSSRVMAAILRGRE